MAQASEFPLRKPPGFHYDFFLLGITTFIAGLISLPAPNGLVPQAPIHTKSLLVTGQSQQIASRPQVHSDLPESQTAIRRPKTLSIVISTLRFYPQVLYRKFL